MAGFFIDGLLVLSGTIASGGRETHGYHYLAKPVRLSIRTTRWRKDFVKFWSIRRSPAEIVASSRFQPE
jgi:hypothetical protein